MSDFPILKTGAVLQYPAAQTLAFSTHVMRFVDGSEQRCPLFGSPIRKWGIRLDLLDEQELRRMELFFDEQQGQTQDFSFTDPWSGTVYPSCHVEGGEIALEYLQEGQGRTELIIQENRS